MYFYVNNQGTVKMRSETRIKNHGNLREIEDVVDMEKAGKLQENYILKEKNGKITYEEPPHVKEKRRKENVASVRDQLSSLKSKKQNGQLTADDLYPLIEKLTQ